MALLAELNDDALRALALDALRSLNFTPVAQIQVGEYLRAAGSISFSRGLAKGPPDSLGMKHNRLDPDDDRRLADIIMDLFIEGIIRPGREGQSSEVDWPFFHLTKRGKAVFASQRPTPYDPSGYLGEIRAILGVDDVVVSYVEESVAAFRVRLLRSSVIALGVASERAFTLLLEAFIAAIRDAGQAKTATSHLYKNSMQQAYDAFFKHYKERLIGALKSDPAGKHLAHNIETYLGSMILNVREYRNDAGHALKIITSDRVAGGHLEMFPDYLAKVFGIIIWLKTNSV